MNTALLLCAVTLVHASPTAVHRYRVDRAPYRLRFNPYEVTWASFKGEYGKVYASKNVEEQHRNAFMENIKRMEEHNWQYFIGKASHYLDINQFTDMTLEQYQQYNKLQTAQPANNSTPHAEFLLPLNWKIPSSVDWRAKGYVTAVKDQGQCGSCWAFSATGSMEGQHHRAGHRLVSLSEQQLMDCSARYGNKGCDGGLVNRAFQYVVDVDGIQSEETYPYRPPSGTCKFKVSEAVAKIKAYKVISPRDESALQAAVASQGPVSVAIDASQSSFMSYAGGVYDDPSCSSTDLDHAVLVVGYGSENGKEYWLVKNSWGSTWGDAGYIKMSRNKGNQCGIATEASYPEV